MFFIREICHPAHSSNQNLKCVAAVIPSRIREVRDRNKQNVNKPKIDNLSQNWSPVDQGHRVWISLASHAQESHGILKIN